ncbi:hypothetical protein [uncultured Fibrella sp.]|uniref:hypothetical protein n=1 Tax=uncultured Fibrella sp. TaxID=1284596 RepID=UPI0035CBF2DF
MTRLPLQAAGRRVGPTNSLVYYSLGGLAASFTIGRMTDKTTRQLVRRYNDQLLVIGY